MEMLKSERENNSAIIALGVLDNIKETTREDAVRFADEMVRHIRTRYNFGEVLHFMDAWNYCHKEENPVRLYMNTYGTCVVNDFVERMKYYIKPTSHDALKTDVRLNLRTLHRYDCSRIREEMRAM